MRISLAILIFISICNNIMAMEDQGKNFRKKLLKLHRYEQITQDPAERAMHSVSTKAELEWRAQKLELQKNSYLSRFYHFAYNGARKLLCAGLFMQGGNWLMEETFKRDRSLAHRTATGFCSVGLTCLGVWYGLGGIKSLYNNIFKWQERKENKIKINNAALANLRKRL
jgi:hypothetical protein